MGFHYVDSFLLIRVEKEDITACWRDMCPSRWGMGRGGEGRGCGFLWERIGEVAVF